MELLYNAPIYTSSIGQLIEGLILLFSINYLHIAGLLGRPGAQRHLMPAALLALLLGSSGVQAQFVYDKEYPAIGYGKTVPQDAFSQRMQALAADSKVLEFEGDGSGFLDGLLAAPGRGLLAEWFRVRRSRRDLRELGLLEYVSCARHQYGFGVLKKTR